MATDEVIIFKSINIVNEGTIINADVMVCGDRITKIAPVINASGLEINGMSKYLMPGIIDDQVHFREPGFPAKGNIATESAAAAAGGITSYMEMPNTKPEAITLQLLEEKYQRAAETSVVNYSFYLGATEHNLDVIKSADYNQVCGVKIFMGSSTGNLLVESDTALEEIFKECPALIATHCEDEMTIRNNLQKFKVRYGDMITPPMHPQIRSAEGCYLSSFKAVNLARKHNTRLHILHISTARELSLFEIKDRREKRITSEACVHHLYFDDKNYAQLGNKIKCNPAIKSSEDREAILQGVLDGRIDVIATDHAPHTEEDKALPYLQAPAGLPLIQQSLQLMLYHYKKGSITLEQIVDKMCHAPADIFKIKERGYIREGYFADLVMVDIHDYETIEKDNLLYKCKWSPLEGVTLPGRILGTWVNGSQVYKEGKLLPHKPAKRLNFQFS